MIPSANLCTNSALRFARTLENACLLTASSSRSYSQQSPSYPLLPPCLFESTNLYVYPMMAAVSSCQFPNYTNCNAYFMCAATIATIKIRGKSLGVQIAHGRVVVLGGHKDCEGNRRSIARKRPPRRCSAVVNTGSNSCCTYYCRQKKNFKQEEGHLKSK